MLRSTGSLTPALPEEPALFCCLPNRPCQAPEKSGLALVATGQGFVAGQAARRRPLMEETSWRPRHTSCIAIREVRNLSDLALAGSLLRVAAGDLYAIEDYVQALRSLRSLRELEAGGC